MHIAFVATDYAWGRGKNVPSGIEVYTKTVAEALVRRGHRVTVLTSDHWGMSRGHHECEGVNVEVLQFGKNIRSWSEEIHQWLLYGDVDVVESHNASSPLIVTQVAGNTPTVVRLASGVLDSGTTGRLEEVCRSEFRAEVFTVSEAEIVIAASDGVKARAERYGAKDVRLLPLGLPPEAFKIHQKPAQSEYDVCVMVSRFGDRRKGGDLVMTALEGMRDKRVVVIGEMEDDEADIWREAWPEVTFENKPLDSVILRGFFMASEAVFVPSRSESFGLALLEPLAVGTHVLAFDEVTQVRHGWPLCPVGSHRKVDPKQIATMLSYLEDAAKDHLVDFAKKFHIDRFIEDYEKVYMEAACRKGMR